MGDFQEVFPLQLLAGVAQQAREGGVDGGKPPIQARQRDPEVNLFKNRAEALFRNAQLLVKFAALERQSGLRRNLIDQLAGYSADAIRLIGRHLENPQHARAGLQGDGVGALLLRAEPLTARVLFGPRNVSRLPLPDRPSQKGRLLEGNDTLGIPIPSSPRHPLKFTCGLVQSIDSRVAQPLAISQTRQDRSQHRFHIEGAGQRGVDLHQQRKLVGPGFHSIARPCDAVRGRKVASSGPGRSAGFCGKLAGWLSLGMIVAILLLNDESSAWGARLVARNRQFLGAFP